MKPSAAVAVACLMLTIGPMSLAYMSSAYAQSADLVLCDRIAADPADPDKPADVKGVSEIEPSDVVTAITFCKTASNASRRALTMMFGMKNMSPAQMPTKSIRVVGCIEVGTSSAARAAATKSTTFEPM